MPVNIQSRHCRQKCAKQTNSFLFNYFNFNSVDGFNYGHSRGNINA